MSSSDRPPAPPRRPWSIRVRITVITLVVGAVAFSGITAVSLAVLARASSNSISTVLADRIATLQTRISVHAGIVRVAEGNDALFDATSWVYDGRGRLVDGAAVPAGLRPTLRRLSRVSSPTEDASGAVRFRAAPIQHGQAVVVVGVGVGPYLSSLREALAVNVTFGLLAVLAIGMVAFLVTRRALRPVAAMARTAENWSRGRLADRFGLGSPRDELTELASVLDRLLDRVAVTIADEERLTAELAHELRTPLTVIDGEAQLALRDPASAQARLHRIRSATVRMGTAMHALLDAARSGNDGSGTADVNVVISAAIRAHPARSQTPITHLGSERRLRAAAPPALVDRMLAPLLDNAAKHARSTITITAAALGSRIIIDVSNDGPGIPNRDRDRIFSPGFRDATSSGAGLGLPLALRLAATVDGQLVLHETDPVVFRLIFPSAD